MSDWVNIIGIVVGTVGMVMNTIAWLVILRTKHLHNMTNYLLAYLAVTDSIVCFSFILYNTGFSVADSSIGREIYCWIFWSYIMYDLSTYSTTYCLCLVTYERYIGIVHPLHYPRLMSAKKVTLIIFVAGVMSILFVSPRLYNATANTSRLVCNSTDLKLVIGQITESDVLFIICGYLLPILFMGLVYYKIQATLKRSAHQLQQQNVQGAALELLQARQNVISTLRIVVGALVLLWTPSAILVTVCLPKPETELCYSAFTLFPLLQVMYYMNSVINPIIYIFKYKRFRKALQGMLCCCISRPLRPNRIDVQIAMNERNVLDANQELSIA